VKFLPFIDIQVNGIQSTSIAPFSLIFEHIVHNFGIILVGVAAAIGGGEVVKNLIFFLMPVAIVLLVLPFVNLLVNYMEGNEY
jgi:hypothetical protein